jgi:GT2 family glycosyltransferase
MTKLRVINCAMGGNIANGDFLIPILESLGLEYVTISEWPQHDIRWASDKWLRQLANADIVVCPQRVALQPAKSANRATQAMALGLPVVASPLPSYKEAIRHGETGFLCDTPEEWRQALEKLANDGQLRKSVGTAAKESVKAAYSITAVGGLWKGLLDDLSHENCVPPKCDIIIPTWNNLEYLKLCIDSIRKGTDHPHNIIVVTSGTDGTADWLRAQPDVIHHISDRRLHFAEANNVGLSMAKERYVMLLNDDTIVGKGWLSALMHEAMKPGVGAVGPLSNCDRGWLHEEALVVAGKELVPGMNREDVARIIPHIQDFHHEKTVRDRKWIAFYATLLPRAAVDKVGLLDEGFKSGDEDLDYCKRLGDAGYRIVQTFDSWIFHFGGKTRKNSQRADQVLHDREDRDNHDYFTKKWGVPPSDALFRNPDLAPRLQAALSALDIPFRGAEAQSPLFVLYTGKAFERWTPKNLDDGGIGGSETATVYTARDFVRKGWRAKVFGDCDGQEGLYDGVEYLHHEKFPGWVQSEKADLFVSSRRPDVFSLPIRAGRSACLAHDIWLSPDKNADLHVDRVDLFFVLSPWHKQFFMSHHQGVPEAKIHVTRDGVDLERFKEPLRRIKGRMIYSSSPDRGLETLLDCLPRIKKEVPHAEVHVFYGFYNWLKFSEMRNDQPTIARIKTLQARLKDPGVVFRDRLGQRALAQEMLQAELCAFPTWFQETFFITGTELMAAGVPIVTSDLAAIQTTVGEAGILIPGDSFSQPYRDRLVEECVLMLTAPSRWQKHHELGLERAKRFSWKGIADEWCQALGIGSVKAPLAPTPSNGRKIVYAFDVDETIEVSAGPVPLAALAELRKCGHIVGLCGNWAVFVERTPNWHEYVSFMGPHGTPKETFLKSMRTSLKADEYVLVGNVKGVSGVSDDQGAAQRSGWRFIQEAAFSKGAR